MASDLWRWQASNPQGYPPNATFYRDQKGKKKKHPNSNSSATTVPRGHGPFRRFAAWVRRVAGGIKRAITRRPLVEL